jgi:hypothetical protein
VNVGGEPGSLIPTLEDCSSEVNVVNVKDAAVLEIQIGALAGPRLAGPPRQIVLAVIGDREAAENHIAKEMPA